MKSLQEFEQFLATDTELVANVTQLESYRKRTKSSFFIILLIVIVFVGGAGYFMYNQSKEMSSEADTGNTIYMILIFVGIAFVISYLYAFLSRRKMNNNPEAMKGGGSGDFQFDFKDRVIRKMVAFWDPSFRYQINNHIKTAEVLESGMLYPKNYKAGGSDMIQGEIDGISFRFSDLHLLSQKTFVEKGEDPYTTVMFGSFFMAGFPKNFRHPVFVYSKSSMDALQHEGEKVLLEDPEFMDLFHVYAADQVEARYILTTSLMERIKTMARKMGKHLYIAFANNKLYVMNNNGHDRFETSWFQQVDKKETLLRFYNELAEQLSIIEELKLNNNIWNSQ